MNIYERRGVRTLINAKGPATRLSGGVMRPEVTAAMAEAAGHCVDMAELEAHASQVIARLTGAEAGYVASGAAACLLLATAACVTGLEPGRMARLPDTAGMRDEVIVVRSQRNFYDHAIRAAGIRLVEVGLPDRYSGAGVRDAEAWEIADAITDRTAAIFYVADSAARPPLREVVAAAHAAGIPVIVDAAAQLPPQSNLRRFIEQGADLVAFSGGKAINGPQATGILCGKRDLSWQLPCSILISISSGSNGLRRPR
jgi:L-seryl-tRNA(Ser) seleniumtransferase